MSCKEGISLIELIVVLTIVAVSLGIFFPAAHRVREAARRTVCKNNLRQINLGLIQQIELVGIPPTNPQSNVGGWAIELLPFLEQSNLKLAMPKDVPLDRLDSEFFVRPLVYRCPTQFNTRPTIESGIQSTHYLLVEDPSIVRRESYFLSDAPMNVELPWASSPEWTNDEFRVAVGEKQGPHYGGFHSVALWSHGVEYRVGD